MKIIKLSSLTVEQLKTLLGNEIEKRETEAIALDILADYAPAKSRKNPTRKSEKSDSPIVYNGIEYKSWVSLAQELQLPDSCKVTWNGITRFHAQSVRRYLGL